MNTLLVLSAVETGLRSIQELNALLTRVQMENRDVSDDEIAALSRTNDLVSAELIKRLRDETS